MTRGLETLTDRMLLRFRFRGFTQSLSLTSFRDLFEAMQSLMVLGYALDPEGQRPDIDPRPELSEELRVISVRYGSSIEVLIAVFAGGSGVVFGACRGVLHVMRLWEQHRVMRAQAGFSVDFYQRVREELRQKGFGDPEFWGTAFTVTQDPAFTVPRGSADVVLGLSTREWEEVKRLLPTIESVELEET